MSVNIDRKAINDLKRKAKVIKEEASVYGEISQTKHVFEVSAE